MPRLNISQLPFPTPKYRPDLLATCGPKRFESEDDARKEDRIRAKLLRKAATLAMHHQNARAANALADTLDYGDADPPATIASSLFMRHHRIRVGGAIARVFDELNHTDRVTFHLTPRGLDIPAAELQDFNPIKACKALRAVLDRIGVSRAEGELFAYVDGEHEVNSDVFRIHFHGFAVGAKAAALERLRAVRNFRSKRYRSQAGRSVQRVRIHRKLDNLPYHLSYLVKSFWPSRWEGVIDGRLVRQSFRSRIPEPQHSQMLLWMDRWRLQDLCVLIGLQVGKSGLQSTQKTVRMEVGNDL